MTKAELKLVASFLEELDNRFGEDGCNDYELPNTPENRKLLKKAFKWGCASDADELIKEMEEDTGPTISTMNNIVCGYLAHLAKKESE
jgi:hypothetical protein